MNNKKTIARRKILKAAAISGGAVVGAKSLPNTWTQPALNAVMTPAHAQTSTDTMDDASDGGAMAITGTFAASGLQGPIASINQWLHQPQLALLDVVVPQVMANSGALDEFCGNVDSPGGSVSFNLLFRLNENGMVDIAMDGSFFTSLDGNPTIICSGNSTITDTAIADASINIGNSDNLDCSLDLSGMVASESEITGNWQFVDGNQDSGSLACEGMFAAALGGDFPTTASCTDQFIGVVS